jgi:hypothetical protein
MNKHQAFYFFALKCNMPYIPEWYFLYLFITIRIQNTKIMCNICHLWHSTYCNVAEIEHWSNICMCFNLNFSYMVENFLFLSFNFCNTLASTTTSYEGSYCQPTNQAIKYIDIENENTLMRAAIRLVNILIFFRMVGR